MGFTLVCEDVTRSENDMKEVCPAKRDIPWAQAVSRGTPGPAVSRGTPGPALTEGCSCLPRRGVEQDLVAGISPLGSNYKGCVKLEQELIFPNIKGTFLLKAIHFNIPIYR